MRRVVLQLHQTGCGRRMQTHRSTVTFMGFGAAPAALRAMWYCVLRTGPGSLATSTLPSCKLPINVSWAVAGVQAWAAVVTGVVVRRVGCQVQSRVVRLSGCSQRSMRDGGSCGGTGSVCTYCRAGPGPDRDSRRPAHLRTSLVSRLPLRSCSWRGGGARSGCGRWARPATPTAGKW